MTTMTESVDGGTDVVCSRSSVPIKKRLSRCFSESSNAGQIGDDDINHSKQVSSKLIEDIAENDENEVLPACENRLPGKKRWLKSATEVPSKKRVSLNDYLERKKVKDGCSEGGFTSSDTETDNTILDQLCLEVRNPDGRLVELTIDSLEARKKQLKEALLSMEKRREKNNDSDRSSFEGTSSRHRNTSSSHTDTEDRERRHQKQKHKNSNRETSHNSHHKSDRRSKNIKCKPEMSKQMKALEHFMSKQENQLRKREEEKKAERHQKHPSKQLINSALESTATSSNVSQKPVRTAHSTVTKTSISGTIDNLRKVNDEIERQLIALRATKSGAVSKPSSTNSIPS